MQIKSVKPINFLFFRTETKTSELHKYALVGQDLFKEAVNHKLLITGPVHWHYIGFAGDLEKPFTLEISLPVGEVLEEYDGKFHFKRTEPFKCVSTMHEGNWFDIPKSYDKVFEFITSHRLQPLASTREIYINVDFKHPEANVTEIQMAVN